MAPPPKNAGGNIPANVAPTKSQPSNGVVMDNTAPAVNRKKQKRRQKQAAKAAAQDKPGDTDYASDDPDDELNAPPGNYAPSTHRPPHPDLHYNDAYLSQRPEHLEGADGTEFAYSDEENQYAYDPAYPANGTNDHYTEDTGRSKKRSKRKKKGPLAQYDDGYDDPVYDPNGVQYPPIQRPAPLHRSSSSYPPPAISDEALRTVHQRVNDPIWDSSTLEERSNIRKFWISLAEDKRKELVRIEKEAVLRKMKEQQKHSCSCTVCGRKRTAIEEELEVLYDAYYEELKQFANTSQPRSVNGTAAGSSPSRRYVQGPGQRTPVSQARRITSSRIQELPDDDDGEVEDEDADDEGYSDDLYEADGYSGDESDSVPPGAEDILAFGRSLTVKAGGVLTVADELLRNDGRKFIDMMEKLAERRMRRESRAYAPYDNAHPSMPPQQHPPPPPPTHDYSEEEEYDEEDDEEYESQDAEFDEEDETDAMTEQQRMAEGRRMFQIFAARMFEQRVLNAYREMVARERQDRLIAEMEEESRADTQRDAKKARDAEKKKAKKQQQKQKQAEVQARKDEAKAAAEAEAREAEAKRQAELQQKRDEQRKKKEAERKAQEDEKLRKEAEKQRRQQEERQRLQDVERKAKEAKAEEKRRRDEAKRQERDEREAREQAARDKKAHEEQSRREREEKSKAEAEALERRRKAEQRPKAPTAEAPKRPQLPAIVALPPGFKQQKSYTGLASPQPKVMTPILPKAPTPTRPRDISTSASHTSDPNTSDAAQISQKSTPPKLSAAPVASQPSSAGSNRIPNRPPQVGYPQHISPSHAVPPPPGMPPAMQFTGMPPSMNGFPHGQPQMMPQQFQHGRPMHSHGPTMSMPMRPSQHPGAPYAPGPQGPFGAGRGFANPGAPPAGFGPTRDLPPMNNPRPAHQPARELIGRHSRQASSSFEHTSQAPELPIPTPTTNPIARPAPIKRPDSTKPQDNGYGSVKRRAADADDETEHFGSSALLSDALDDVPSENRKPSTLPPPSATSSLGSAFDHGPGHFGSIGRPSIDTWRHPGGFGQPPLGSATGWGSASGGGGGWSSAGSFGGSLPRAGNARPVTVRKLACEAFRGRPEKPMDIELLLREMDKIKPAQMSPVYMSDLEGILDTEGDSHNGGGSFSVNQHGQRVLVLWTPDYGGFGGPGRGGPVPGLGEIGSPLPGSGFPAGIGGRH